VATIASPAVGSAQGKPRTLSPGLSPNLLLVGDFIKHYGAVTVTVATAVAYFMGYASVSAFAAELGVSPRDLGLDVRDYLLLASINIVSWITVYFATMGYAFVYTMLTGARVKPWIRITFMGVSFGVVFGLAINATLYSTGQTLERGAGGWFLLPPISILVIFLIGAVARTVVVNAHNARRGSMRGVVRLDKLPKVGSREMTIYRVVPVLAGVVLIFCSYFPSVYGARAWANSLEFASLRGIDSPPRGPFGLALIIQPSQGEITFTAGGRDVRVCGMRLSDKLMINSDGNSEIRDIDVFEHARCDAD